MGDTPSWRKTQNVVRMVPSAAMGLREQVDPGRCPWMSHRGREWVNANVPLRFS